jgi:hypothetical protein
MNAKTRSYIYLIVIVPLLSGCALFTSHYAATRHENFTKLKAVHAKFFEDWTEGSDKVWSESIVKNYCDLGDLKFREAYEYAKSTDNDDKTGQKAVKILWSEFKDNCKLSLKRKKMFSKVFTQELWPEIDKNYQYAISGELARVKSRQ